MAGFCEGGNEPPGSLKASKHCLASVQNKSCAKVNSDGSSKAKGFDENLRAFIENLRDPTDLVTAMENLRETNMSSYHTIASELGREIDMALKREMVGGIWRTNPEDLDDGPIHMRSHGCRSSRRSGTGAENARGAPDARIGAEDAEGADAQERRRQKELRTHAQERRTQKELRTQAQERRTQKELRTHAQERRTQKELRTQAQERRTQKELRTQAQERRTQKELRTQAQERRTPKELRTQAQGGGRRRSSGRTHRAEQKEDRHRSGGRRRSSGRRHRSGERRHRSSPTHHQTRFRSRRARLPGNKRTIQNRICHGSLYAVMWLADEPREFNLPTLPQRCITYEAEKLPCKYGVHSEEMYHLVPSATGWMDGTAPLPHRHNNTDEVTNEPTHYDQVSHFQGQEMSRY
ncbi:hypothetical protein ANN_20078 [Periplaneta americana]|uniref:Uncharacterized protein n=1 Tax=Periplaneta americana TaxID=6978 RepID=A0ABQ8SCA3_PERAM|nr:hypothetical protein ANN_20078 [Periplaneta americana]